MSLISATSSYYKPSASPRGSEMAKWKGAVTSAGKEMEAAKAKLTKAMQSGKESDVQLALMEYEDKRRLFDLISTAIMKVLNFMKELIDKWGRIN